MIRKTLLLGISCSLMLAGCFQQSTDSFQTVNSSAEQLSTPQTNPADLATPIIIMPDGAASPLPEALVELQGTANTIILPGDLATQPMVNGAPPTTPTVIIIMPGVETATPSQPLPGSLLPTATPPMLITPQAPSQLVLATGTPLGAATAGGANPPTNGIQTPTDFPTPVNEACSYTISSGDTLFRIALNNDVSLDALLTLNELSSSSIIQPGQVIQLPSCTDGSTNPSLAATQAVTGGNSAPAPLEGTSAAGNGAVTGQVMHTVASGETLSTIAQKYGVTINAIVQANSLSNPNALSIGQQLVIPGQ